MKNLDKAGKSAHSVDRRLKGAARASSNSTKNFSKMSQGISGGLVPAYATLAASMFAVTAVFRGLEQAFNWKAQTEGLKFFADQTGVAMETLVVDMRAATLGLLEFKDAAQAAQIGIAAGLGPKDLVELAEGAKLVSGALGRDLEDSFNRLIRGVTKAEPELLDELGIVLRLDIATRKYAAAHGLVQNELTLTQRMAAVNAEVMTQLNSKFGEFRGVADELVNPFTRLQTAFSDLMKDISEYMLPPLVAIAEFLSDNTEAAALLMAGFAASIMRSAFPALKSLSTSMIKFGTDSAKASKQATKEFEKASAKYKLAKKDWTASDVVHQQKFRKILKKMGIDQDEWLKKNVINQERSLKQMLNNEKKHGAKVKVLKKKELEYIKGIHGQILASHQAMTSRMIAGANAASLALTSGMARAGAATSGIMVGIGLLAKKLAPTMAFLGSAMGWLFGIATAVFIGKFIWDWVAGTGMFDKKAQALDRTWEGITSRLREVNKLMESQTNSIDTAVKGTQDYNEALIKQANIYSNLAAISVLDEGLGVGLEGSNMLALTEFYADHLGTHLMANAGAAQKVLEEMEKEAKRLTKDDPTGPMADILPGPSRIQTLMKADLGTDEGMDKFRSWLDLVLPLLMKNKTFVRKLGIELHGFGQTAEVVAGVAIKNLNLELESLLNIQDRLTSKFKPTSLDQYRQAIMGTITEAKKATKEQGNAFDFVGTLKSKQIKPESLGIDDKTGSEAAIKQLESTGRVLALSHQLTTTLGVRVAMHKRMATIAGKLGTAYGKQEERLHKIKAHEAESEELAARMLANKLLFSSLGKEQQILATQTLANDLIKLENLGYQIESLREMNDLMISIRDAGIQAFDRAGQKGIKDLIMGKEKSLGDAVLKVASSTLDGMATALSEKMMAPITGGLKKALGIESPEEKQKKILNKHVTDLKAALQAHIKGIQGGTDSDIEGLFGDKDITKSITDKSGKITGSKKSTSRGLMGMFEDLLGGMMGGAGGWMSSLFGMFGGMFGAEGGVVRKYGSGTGPEGAKFVPGSGNRDTVPAMLTPGEIVVPKGKRVGGNYNTTINVNMEGGGDVTTDDDAGEALGMAIQMAVTDEIANQQRPGGLLSPFGGG